MPKRIDGPLPPDRRGDGAGAAYVATQQVGEIQPHSTPSLRGTHPPSHRTLASKVVADASPTILENRAGDKI
ncbi:MAG: hypothetical protein ACRDU4_13405 [Mycobacterium sp.]